MTGIEGIALRIAHGIGIEKGVEIEIRIARILETKCVKAASPTIGNGAILNKRYEKLTKSRFVNAKD